MFGPEVLDTLQNKQIDRIAVATGATGRNLMAAAARSVTRYITKTRKPCPVWVICGPGNNGGDGLLIAHKLLRLGWSVTIVSSAAWRDRLGDAAWAASILPISELNLTKFKWPSDGLLIDAAFGNGLNRPLEDEVKEFFNRTQAAKIPILAVDILSGFHGTTGTANAIEYHAQSTVTFVRPNIGHFLLPGRLHGGDLIVASIGIENFIVNQTNPRVKLNSPAIWAQFLPVKPASSHKYSSGHTVVIGGKSGQTGAATMTALAADQVGSGLVTVGCDSDDVHVYEKKLIEVMIEPIENVQGLATWLSDQRIKSIAIGPAFGISSERADWLEAVLKLRKPTIVDADAITIMGLNPDRFIPLVHSDMIFTPHDGEFVRIAKASGTRLERAVAAAKQFGATFVLKGADCIVAAPCGKAVISTHAPSRLAKAGSGDVLCGIIAGLVGQGMSSFDAACAGTWLHGQAGRANSWATASELVTSKALFNAMISARSYAVAHN